MNTHFHRSPGQVVLLILYVALFWTSCAQNTIKIGFVGTLSGSYSQLGISSRDGFLLAVSQRIEDFERIDLNLESEVGNDLGDVSLCRDAMESLLADGAFVIVGPLMSSMEPAIREVVGNGGVVVSPTVTTEALSGLDDGFIRFIPSTSNQGRIAAGLLRHRGISSVTVVYDGKNPQYVDEVVSAFRDYFYDEGHSIVSEHRYTDYQKGTEAVLADITAEDGDGPEAVFFVTNGTDAALLAQKLRFNGYDGLLVGSQWTRTTDLLTHGGRAVEGMLSTGFYPPDEDSPEYEEFVSSFIDFVGYPPDFAATYSYEATRAILTVVIEEGSADSARIKERLVNRTYNGLRDDIHIDGFGDAYRPMGFSIVRDGRFIDFPYED